MLTVLRPLNLLRAMSIPRSGQRPASGYAFFSVRKGDGFERLMVRKSESFESFQVKRND